MKNFTLLLLGVCLAGSLQAQRSKSAAEDFGTRLPAHVKRCATMEALKTSRAQNPQDYQQQMALRRAQAASLSTMRTSTLNGPVTIPVVVHVVLSNPNIITDEAVDALINRLNLDYAGTNGDSANASNFYSVRGHSNIRFARARRTPAGALTNGIERRVSLAQIAMDTYQDVKHYSDGGLDPWNIDQYYNIWVASAGSTGLLGIAPAIGKGNATETASSTVGIDGVCIDYRCFTTTASACFTEDPYDMGRTAVHEIGHNFGLYHTFQYDDQNGYPACTAGGDFMECDNPLPPALVGFGADDTPNQSSESGGCPSSQAVNSDCGAFRKMFQNYMDYTDDACMTMFTKKQVNRMEYILETYRSGYLTSLGAVPPANAVALDISPATLVSPGGKEFKNAGCTITTYPTPMCAGNVTPRILVTNNGSATITSFTVSLSVNNGPAVTTNATGLSITPGAFVYVSLPSVALAVGNNTLKFTTSAPNGGTDAVTSNDVITHNVTIAPPVAAPITEGFEGASMTSLSVLNPDNDTTWRQASPGRTGSYSLYINNYDNDAVGTVDHLRSVPMNLITGADSLVISFDQAYKFYRSTSGATVITDTLLVTVTSDCGATYNSVFKKGGATLAAGGSSNGGQNTIYTSPATADWRNERIAVSGAVLTPGRVVVQFTNYNGYGNNMFLDNINISSVCRTTTINTQPAAVSTCAGQPASFTVAATGNATLSYQWKKDGNPITTGGTSATYSIGSVAAANAGNYTVDITNACGVVSTSNIASLTVNTGGACSSNAVSNINPDIAGVVLMPSAVRSNTTLRVNAVRAQKMEWTVIDAEGRIVKRFVQNVVQGQNDLRLNLSGLASGAYQLSGNSNKGRTNTVKFVRL